MRLFVLLLGVVVPVAWICAGRGPTTLEPVAHAEPPVVPRSAQHVKFELQGAGSCAAMACHNADGTGYRGREYRIALERDFQQNPICAKDKHAQAYAVLFQERSVRIVRHLWPNEKDAHPTRKHECLVCHVHPNYKSQPEWLWSEGVSCEGCHGPAERWRAMHFRPEFQKLDSAARHAYGMNDTRSLAGRVKACVVCHIGTKDADVNHDLIAAGHPRLDFEFSAFHHEWHKHWDIRKDKDPAHDRRGRKDFEALSWAVGQIASAEAALRLLAGRAGNDKAPWTELSEYNCFACHHDIKEKSWRQDRYVKGDVGKLKWSPWHYAMLNEAIEAIDPAAPRVDAVLQQIAKELESLGPDRKRVGHLAEQAADALNKILDRQPWMNSPMRIDALFRRTLERADSKSAASWDHAQARYAALAALARAKVDQGGPATKLEALQNVLRFPLGFDSPRDYDPDRADEAIRGFKQLLQK